MSLTTAFGQNIKVEGYVVNDENNALEGATVIFSNAHSDQKKYTTTDQDGFFRIFLPDDTMVHLKVTFIGYEPAILTLQNLSETIQVTLNELTESLGEIKLNYVPEPVIVKKDTITFDISKFVDGEEFKMIHVLEKLPGVAVVGNQVLVQGKEVKKVLVEGDAFFQGNTTFAIENIPADVISKIEVIDDYNEVAFLSRLTDDDATVINVKLKEDKQHFYFGETKLGYGNNHFFDLKNDYITYSKKTQFAVVGAVNNTSGPLDNIANLLLRNPLDATSELNRSLFDWTFQDKFYKENLQAGVGVSLKHKIKENSQLGLTALYKNQTDEKEQFSSREYLNPVVAITEESHEKQESNQNNLIFDLAYAHNFSDTETLRINSFTDFTKRTQNLLYSSITQNSDLNSNELGAYERLYFNNNISYFKKFNEKITTTLNFNYYKNAKVNDDEYATNEVLFMDFFDGELFNQKVRDESTGVKISGEFFYTIFKNFIVDLKINTGHQSGRASIKLASPFEEAFSIVENDLDLKTANATTGISYAYKRFRFYSSIDLGIVNTTFYRENFLAPQFKISYKKSVEKEVSLKYEYIVRPASLFEMRDFAYVKNRNTLALGNSSIKPVKYHLLNFNYYLSDFSSGITFFGNAVYLNYAQFLMAENQFENQKNTEKINSTNLDREELTLQIVLGKVFEHVKVNVSPQWNITDYPQKTAEIEVRNTNSKLRLRLNGETLFKQFPNVRLSFTHTLNRFKNDFVSSDFNVSQFSFGVFKNSKKMSYGVNYVYSKSSNILLDNIHYLSFRANYNFPDSRWSVFIEADNLLEESFYTTQFVTDIAIAEQQISRIPRNIIAGIAFKF